mgnify:CR=1 FL=1|tara:strand:- start:1201 stop:1398 length:198 start_codon:yes stop_codon:yes gene_type:complete
MDINDIIGLSVEGSLSLMLVIVAYKIYKMRIQSHSGCCLENGGNGIVLETVNSGVSAENDVLNNL